MKGHRDRISSLVISTDGKLIASGWYCRLQQCDVRTEKQISDHIKVPPRVEKPVISNDGETFARRSFERDCVQKWETMTGKPICEPKRWSKREHLLYEVEPARLCSDQECYRVFRKDELPIEIECRAACLEQKKLF